MNEIERVLIVGAGAVGAAVASIIHESDPHAVSVLADGERFDRYGRDGFLVNGRHYRFPVAAPGKPEGTTGSGAPRAGAAHRPADLIILAVKHHHLSEAMEQMRSHVGPETTVLSLLNGISSEELLGEAFGPGPGAPDGCGLPPYAMILGIDAVRVGNETRFASAGKIFFGESTNEGGKLSPRVARIARFFDRVGIPYTVPENMLRALWYKFMINVGINQASAVLRAPYRLFQTQREARALMESLQREVIALSQAVGVGLGEQDLANWEETLSKLHADNLTSMCQDVLACRKTEVEMFAGAVVDLGRKHGVPTPTNEVFFNLLRAMEQSY